MLHKVLVKKSVRWIIQSSLILKQLQNLDLWLREKPGLKRSKAGSYY